MRTPYQLIFLVPVCFSSATLGQNNGFEEAGLQAKLKAGDTAGFSLAVHSSATSFSSSRSYSSSDTYGVQSGWQDPDTKTPITDMTAFRLAGITKTYVASTVLRLREEGLIDLQSPISELIDPTFDQTLRNDGYDTDKILLIHLLTHTGGVFDHAEDEKYVAAIIENPAVEWTAAEQIKACVDWGDPVGQPGELFSYSDTGYVLVGNIIERITNKSLAASVRQWLDFEKLGIKQTYWERFEKAPVDQNRTHQFYQELDTYNWNPTMDLFGGGGLVATPSDVALFFNKLLTGQVFKNKETLNLMLNKAELPENSSYRIGIGERNISDKKVYGHSGFWGTLVMHDPATNKTVAGAVIRRSDYDVLEELIAEAIKE